MTHHKALCFVQQVTRLAANEFPRVELKLGCEVERPKHASLPHLVQEVAWAHAAKVEQDWPKVGSGFCVLPQGVALLKEPAEWRKASSSTHEDHRLGYV